MNINPLKFCWIVIVWLFFKDNVLLIFDDWQIKMVFLFEEESFYGFDN